MAKLYIDGNLVADVGFPKVVKIEGNEVTIGPGKTYSPAKLPLPNPVEITIPVLTVTKEIDWGPLLHATRECLTLPTYFCPHCAREALAGVDVSDPSGWRGR